MLLSSVCKRLKPLNELDGSALQQRTSNSFPSRIDNSDEVRIRRKMYTKLNDNELMVKVDVQGKADDYISTIVFTDVEFSDVKDPEAVRVNELYIKPLKANQDVRVHCTCPDFRWTFSWPNKSNNALQGDPAPAYNRTTNRPPRNPTNSAGLCKHLIKSYLDVNNEHLVGGF